jgi:serine-type D-Ala-D-Ala carboxypeptidase (penicillin-binding protein 5/6)
MPAHSPIFGRRRVSRAAVTRRAVVILPPTVLLLILVGTLAGRAAPFQTKAPYALLVDYNTGAVLFEKKADAPVAPASTTKILTAEIVFRELAEGRLHLGDRMTISPKAAREGDAESGGSSMFAQANTQVSVEDLLRGLLVTSGNDAAIALAEGVAGSENAFAARMNQEARQLGMSHSRFTNAWGNGSGGQRVTARDMARLAAYVIATYPQFYHYFGETEFTWNNVRQMNRNPLLGMNLGADGLKTGHLEASGYGLVGSAVQNGRRLILVLYGARTEAERASEARNLMEVGFRGPVR